MSDMLFEGSQPEQPQRRPESELSPPPPPSNSQPMNSATPPPERAVYLLGLVGAMTRTLIQNTTTLGESMYVAHAIYDEVLFRAVTKVINETIDRKLDECVKGLYRQGALNPPGGFRR